MSSPGKMLVLADIQEARQTVRGMQARGESVGLVPTMGALHAGHLSLIEAAKQRCDRVAVSIFVNPTQFGPNEDFQRYPRPMEADLDACRRSGVDAVFTPAAEAMYPDSPLTVVQVESMSKGLCGAFRPGHFAGVATVVAKLFNISQADLAFFGEKDYQQLAIIRRMVRDLNMPIEIVGCPTVREPDGLALSSRNIYLSTAERARATCLSRSLFAAQNRVANGERRSAVLSKEIRAGILAAGEVVIEYVEVVDAESLTPIETINRPARICLAVRIGATRLIDNVGVE